jgi:hypothetical protein
MKQILTLIVAVLCTATLMAGNITPEAAKQIARKQLSTHQGATRAQQAEPKLVYTSNGAVTASQTEALTTDAAYYVFNGDAGYVVIAGDDRQTELLGYSDSGTFPEDGKLPTNVKSWLDFYAKEYKMLQNTPESSFYQEFMTRTDDYKSSVSPLLGDIQWDQDEPYSNSCPLDGGVRSATGCVATAMAQVMKYYNYPEKGTGSVSYTTYSKGLSVSCDFSNLTFDWSNMLPTYTTGNYNTTQANAVATLMFACGASTHTNYTKDESGSVTQYVAYALRENFSYDNGVSFAMRNWYTNAQWMSLVKGEISNGRPVVYGGDSNVDGGHEFVLDGYDTNNYFHVNWGWSGYYDGYFKITSLKPESVGTGGGDGASSGYNINQDMVFGIQKPTSTTATKPVFYLKELKTSKSTVTLGSKFDATAYYLHNLSGSFTGNIALLLIDSNNNVTTISKSGSTSCGFYQYYQNIMFTNIAIPSSTAAGTYTLCCGVTTDNGKTWTLANTATNEVGKLKAYVANNTVTFSNYYGEFNAKVSDYSFANGFFVGADNKITMTLDNSTRGDIYTTLGLGITSADGKSSYNLSLGALELTEDESTKTITCSFSLPDSIGTGSYTVVPLAEWGATLIKIGSEKTIEVGTASSDASLLRFITYPTTDKEVYAPDEAINISCQVGLSDETQNYVDTWYWFVFPYPGGTSLTYVTNTVTIEKDDVLNIKFSFTPDLSDGKYFIVPYSLVNGTTKKVVDSKYCPVFTISSQATGIEDISSDEANSLVIYPQPVEETLNMRSPGEAQSVDIYDISGRRVVSQSLGGGRSHSVGVGSLTAGTYIINVNCGGKIYKEKFVKR